MKKLQRASVKTPFFALSLLVGFLFVLSPGSAAAQSAIPPFDGPTPIRSDVTALGELCSGTTGATKTAGAYGERGTGTKDTCLADTTTHKIFCTYDSANGTYHDATYCTVTYKEIPPPNNTKVFDITGLGTVRTATTTEDIADNSTADHNPSIPAATCSLARLDVCIVNLPGQIFALLAFLMLMISSIVLGIAGTVFNWVIIRTVFQFGTYFGTSESMLVTWGVIRDIGNIALLFGFIFVGVATILNTHSVEGFTAKKALPRLIIFAVLLNFSLFASQGVIDVANGFSSVFATLSGNECSQTTSNGSADQTGTQTFEDCANLGISSKVLEAVGMHKVFPSSWGDVTSFGANLWNQPYSYTVLLLLSSLFVTITAMVLLAGAIMLIIRVVSLTLLMVTSPIGFAGMAIPPLQGLAKDWWHRLISQSFFAPVYLLMIFISLKLVENLQSGQTSIVDALLGNTAGATGAAVGTGTVAGNMQVIMIFGIVIGFMIAALIVAQKMGAYGAKFATQNAAAMTLGAHGFVARRTIGRASGKIGENIRKSNFGHTETGRFFAGIADKGAKSSFDGRGFGAAAKLGGLDLGKPQKGGYDAIVHHGQEEREKYAKSLKQTDADKAEEKRLNDRKKALENQKKISAQTLDDSKKAVQDDITDLEAQYKPLAQARSDEREIQKAKLEAALNANDGKGDSAAIAREQEALEELTKTHRAAAAAEAESIAAKRTELREAERAHKENVKSIDEQTAAIDKRIKGEVVDGHVISTGVGSNAATYRYAKNLHEVSGSDINRITAGGLASHHASENIIRNAGKSKLEKALGDIKDATEKTADHADDHGGDHGGGGGDHGGGGGGGHAPAGGGGHGGGGHH